MMNFEQSTLASIERIPSVSSISLIDAYGEILYSTIDSIDLNEYLSFVAGMTESLQEQIQSAVIKKVVIKGPKVDSLILFMDSQRVLAVETGHQGQLSVTASMIETIITKGSASNE